MTAHVEFDRIGRTHNPPHMAIDGDPADVQAVAEQVHRFARKYLMSSDYEVAVAPEGTVSIGWGRYGQGQVVTDG